MTPFSPRYALAIGMLIGSILVPATARQLLVEDRTECHDSAALMDPTRFDPDAVLVTDGDRPSVLENERLVAAVEPAPGRRSMLFSVVRQRGLTGGLLQPPSQLPGMIEPDRLESRSLETPEGELPVTFAYERRSTRVRVTAFFLTYDGEPVTSALSTRVRSSLDSLRFGPLPITLFVATASGHQSRQSLSEERLEEWMRGAWQVYREACGTRSPLARADAGRLPGH